MQTVLNQLFAWIVLEGNKGLLNVRWVLWHRFRD